METKSYKTIERKWPSDEWDNEPDKMQWPDEATGLPCLAVRHPRSGHWCGYVGLSENHPLYGKGYDDVDVSVHGGLTYANKCQPSEDESTGICHVPATGEPDHVWWLGFDCAHAGDSSPSDYQNAKERGGIWAIMSEDSYKTLAYVQRECADLAKQLAALA